MLMMDAAKMFADMLTEDLDQQIRPETAQERSRLERLQYDLSQLEKASNPGAADYEAIQAQVQTLARQVQDSEKDIDQIDTNAEQQEKKEEQEEEQQETIRERRARQKQQKRVAAVVMVEQSGRSRKRQKELDEEFKQIIEEDELNQELSEQEIEFLEKDREIQETLDYMDQQLEIARKRGVIGDEQYNHLKDRLNEAIKDKQELNGRHLECIKKDEETRDSEMKGILSKQENLEMKSNALWAEITATLQQENPEALDGDWVVDDEQYSHLKSSLKELEKQRQELNERILGAMDTAITDTSQNTSYEVYAQNPAFLEEKDQLAQDQETESDEEEEMGHGPRPSPM